MSGPDLVDPHFRPRPRRRKWTWRRSWWWWIFAGSTGVVCLALIGYALLRGQDLGDYSTLVQAIFSIVLAFMTAGSIERSDRQIEKAQEQIDQAQRHESAHDLIIVIDVEGNLVIANINKYPIFIHSISVSHATQDSPGTDLLVNTVLQDKAVQSVPFLGHDYKSFTGPSFANINDYTGRYVMLDPVEAEVFASESNPFNGMGMRISYVYGDNPEVWYIGDYKFYLTVDHNFIFRRYPFGPWSLEVVLDHRFSKLEMEKELEESAELNRLGAH